MFHKNFLSDTTILENVILNNKDDNVDFEKLDKILNTDLYEYIMKQENKYNSRVVNGKKISGGQAQKLLLQELYIKILKFLF